ncbi:Panacea domain-containing protein [Nitrobacter sp.]|jgi:uncharacterized phage-associated protein|uniref:Panacea domain-containing protein n=1 Tax=Nitrobacter sp. TaxID=29420 RepID=UPI0029CABA02|nr:type II toxin-antitoxin system antitoxin SocA domain-containing protein [Nitrobacter sp.]
MAYAALTTAKYFLAIPDADSGELISNLKLQKLLYYAQGYHVALQGVSRPLFADKIYAWKHGPVVKTVYNHYSRYRDGALPAERLTTPLDSWTKSFLDEIYRSHGRFSAWALREMTHREPPWLKNYKPNVLDIEIPLSDLRAFFHQNVQK